MMAEERTAEEARLEDDRAGSAAWKRWGPYLSERQWGTVREDYSEHGNAWDYFPHDQARSRAYRWGEDGLLGVSDDRQLLCFALTLWNGEDPILKERLFGLTNSEGNHGEDVKEYYFYLDSTPTHSHMCALYKYPQRAYPYSDLVDTNRRRSRTEPEYELVDTGVFADRRYWDVEVEYAKNGPEELLIQVSVHNRGPAAATLHLLPTLWFRNTWSWSPPETGKPGLRARDERCVEAFHPLLGTRYLSLDRDLPLLFTENESNTERVFGRPNATPYVKDGINNAVVHANRDAVNPERTGTRMASHYTREVPAGGTATVRLRLHERVIPAGADAFGSGFDRVLAERRREADEFYARVIPASVSEDERLVARQAFAGMLWSKQFYHFPVSRWLTDPSPPPDAKGRAHGRNREWFHLESAAVLSMPDTWEYPWFAAWDLAFHCMVLASVDMDFAKGQLRLLTNQVHLHPNGQIPAYEWNFSDVNPPVHPAATWQVYLMDKAARGGQGDRAFLEGMFHKLLMNFTWWVNRKDASGNNVFEGGFLGLDNIGVFDRSAPLPTGGTLEQADGTSWMAMFCLDMLAIALELSLENPVYEDLAVKFYEHFIYIAAAMDRIGPNADELWDEEDGFFYDVLRTPDGGALRMKLHSLVGLIPLFACAVYGEEILEKLPHLASRAAEFNNRNAALLATVSDPRVPGVKGRRLLSPASPEKLRRILARMLDGSEFLSDYGIRALSRHHRDHPYVFTAGSGVYRVDYEPAESSTGLFGGNSNWRGPIWMPVNVLLIQSLRKLYSYFGDEFRVECPTGSGRMLTLWEVADEINRRLVRIFTREGERRAVYGDTSLFQTDPDWRDLILFYEYFHGDNGAGIGASHQTGWTGLVASLILSHARLRAAEVLDEGYQTAAFRFSSPRAALGATAS